MATVRQGATPDYPADGPEDDKRWTAGSDAYGSSKAHPSASPAHAQPSSPFADTESGAGRTGARGEAGAGAAEGRGPGKCPPLRRLATSGRPRRDRSDLLAESFRWMFPRSFERLVPVPDCRVRATLVLLELI